MEQQEGAGEDDMQNSTETGIPVEGQYKECSTDVRWREKGTKTGSFSNFNNVLIKKGVGYRYRPR